MDKWINEPDIASDINSKIIYHSLLKFAFFTYEHLQFDYDVYSRILFFFNLSCLILAELSFLKNLLDFEKIINSQEVSKTVHSPEGFYVHIMHDFPT